MVHNAYVLTRGWGKRNRDSKGFTMVELMVTLALFGIVMGAIFLAYNGQQKHAIDQEQIIQAQQNLRAAMDMVARDIRKAGHGNGSEFKNNKPKDLGITAANATSLSLSWDGNYTSANSNTKTGAYKIVDDGTGSGTKNLINGSNQIVAENIELIEFNYTMEDGTKTLTPSPLDQIEAITISLLVRTAIQNRTFSGTVTYTSDSGAQWSYNDSYRRRFMKTTVSCRNL